MAEATHDAVHRHEPPKSFIRKYIFSLDHKVIGIQYILLALSAVVVGMLMSVLMRVNLSWPGTHIKIMETLFPTGAPGGVMSPEFYLSLVTMHGTIMVFFVLTTAPQGGFGNYFLPIQIGAEDMAFPFLNMMSFWVTFVGFMVLLLAIFAEGNVTIGAWFTKLGESAWGGGSGTVGPIGGWTGYAPLSALGEVAGPGQGAGTSLFIPGGSYVSGALLPAHNGGSPLLWQHLFWFFGHPEVYIAILPGMGATSHILSTFARKPIFGYRAMVFAIFAIGMLGFFVWGHHMFISGMSPYSAVAFSILTLSIGVPSAIKTFNWIGTLWGARIRFTTPMLFALGFVSLFVAGGITGLVLGQTSLAFFFLDTYFVTAHFHLVMGVASIFGMFAATYFWFPKMFGRMMHEGMGKLHFWITFLGVYAIFIPFHAMGMLGMPRRYSYFGEYEFLKNAHGLVLFVTVAAIITVTIQILFYFNFVWSIFKGKKASDNPWEATTLEWTTATPPPHDNFGGKTPVVYRGAYEFGVPGAPDDYVMQTTPDETEANVAAGGAREG